MITFEVCLLTENTNVSSIKVGVNSNCFKCCCSLCCCHVRKLSAGREDKGKSDENATLNATLGCSVGQSFTCRAMGSSLVGRLGVSFLLNGGHS